MAAQRLELTINGERQQVAAGTLAAALAELGFGEVKVATAVNGDFVPAARRAMLQLANGDRLEIVAARAGG
jgi:sulfur carrier protein